MGERPNAKGYLMNYRVQAAFETPSRELPVWIENRANKNALMSDHRRVGTAPAFFPDRLEECLFLHWLWISSIAGSWRRPGWARAVNVFLALICWDSVDTGGELGDVCARQENKEQSSWRVWGCSFRLLLCLCQCIQPVLHLNNSSPRCVSYLFPHRPNSAFCCFCFRKALLVLVLPSKSVSWMNESSV